MIPKNFKAAPAIKIKMIAQRKTSWTVRLALLSAQLLYIGRPFFGQGAESLAHMLESDEEARAFASFLDTEEPNARGESLS